MAGIEGTNNEYDDHPRKEGHPESAGSFQADYTDLQGTTPEIEQPLSPAATSALEARPTYYDPFGGEGAHEGEGAELQSEGGRPTSEGSDTFTVPDDLPHLLDTALMPSGLPGEETSKFYIEGHPDLLVRHNRGMDPENLYRAHDLAQRMAEPPYNIPVLPSQIVEHRGLHYTVTARVDGVPLDTLLDPENTDPQVAGEVDTVLADVATWLRSESDAGHDTVADVYGTQQFMRGTISGHPHPQLWLADLPVFVADNQDYPYNVIDLANGILEAEQASGRRMDQARASLQDTVGALSAASPVGARAADLINNALNTDTPIDFDDESTIT